MKDWFAHRFRFFLPLAHAFRRLSMHDGSQVAGFIAYTILVSLFPFIIFLCSLAGALGTEDTAQQVIDAAFNSLPREVAQTLTPIVREIFKQNHPGLLTIGAIGTLWVASSGVEALRMGTMRGWEIPETRPMWRRRATSLLYIALASFCVLGASLIVIAGPWVIGKLEYFLFLDDTLFFIASLALRLAVGFALIFGMVAVMYRALPPTAIPWRHVWPGAALVAGGWILLASLFSLYLSESGDYTVTYGSLGGVVITLLFLQFGAQLFLLGVEFNAVRVKSKGEMVPKQRRKHRAAARKKVASPRFVA